MISTSIFPGRYVQGDQALHILAEEVERHGRNALVIVDKFVFKHSKNIIEQALGNNIDYRLEAFAGECCEQEISKLAKLFVDDSTNVIIGIGGGKTLDTAKVVSNKQKFPTILIPTIASTDAP